MIRLETAHLDIVRSGHTLIKGFSHRFKSGLIMALTGNNGAGKTTLLKTLAGLLPSHQQTILIDGKDINEMHALERANIISLLLQHSPEQPYCTAQSRISHGLMPTHGFNFTPDPSSCALIEEAARRLNILHLLNRPLAQMSGGEQRLVHLAKCLVNPNVKLLLLDEPSVFLDFSQQERLGNYLQSVAGLGRLVIFSSHDAGFIHTYAMGCIEINNNQALVYDIPKKSRFSSPNFLAKRAPMADFTSTFS